MRGGRQSLTPGAHPPPTSLQANRPPVLLMKRCGQAVEHGVEEGGVPTHICPLRYSVSHSLRHMTRTPLTALNAVPKAIPCNMYRAWHQ